MVSIDHENKKVKLVMKSSEILPILQEEENQNPGYVFLNSDFSSIFFQGMIR